MDGTMYFVCSDQAQLQHPVSLAGQDLHQYQADQWLHSPVLESTHRNQHTQSLSLSSSSFQPAEIHPQQHHHHYQPAAGFNGPFTSSPLFNRTLTFLQNINIFRYLKVVYKPSEVAMSKLLQNTCSCERTSNFLKKCVFPTQSCAAWMFTKNVQAEHIFERSRFCVQPVVQQTPPQSSAVCFPLDREQFIDQQL
ncbi:uncharacterized protein LOC134286736 [Aedes albopictus]|uniref:Uncharacterized protein n=1 Tax=Aedes albopictus TaxID=7160 RepID=A0ABM1Y8F9_AEDAL